MPAFSSAGVHTSLWAHLWMGTNYFNDRAPGDTTKASLALNHAAWTKSMSLMMRLVGRLKM
jgi:hypothetical protein